VAVGAAIGLNTDTMREALRRFRVRRRMELRGTADGVAGMTISLTILRRLAISRDPFGFSRRPVQAIFAAVGDIRRRIFQQTRRHWPG
jgi:hypothetical protein